MSVCMATLMSSSVWADWIEIPHEDKSIRTYNRSIPGSKYKEFRGEVVIKTSMASIIALFDDISACKQWLYECVSAQKIEVVDFSERFIYQVNNVHLFANVRDYIVHSKMVENPSNNNISIFIQARPDFCIDSDLPQCQSINQSGYIRVTRLIGKYELQKIDKGNIKVIWTQHIEPAGHLPNFITNYLLDNIPYQTLKNMRNLVTRDKYRSAKLVRDSSGAITGIEN